MSTRVKRRRVEALLPENKLLLRHPILSPVPEFSDACAFPPCVALVYVFSFHHTYFYDRRNFVKSASCTRRVSINFYISLRASDCLYCPASLSRDTGSGLHRACETTGMAGIGDLLVLATCHSRSVTSRPQQLRQGQCLFHPTSTLGSLSLPRSGETRKTGREDTQPFNSTSMTP